MRRVTVALTMVLSLVAFSAAWACPGNEEGGCPLKGTKMSLVDKDGGYLVTMESSGCPRMAQNMAAMVEACTKGQCGCPKKEACPFNVEKVDYKMERNDKGLTILVKAEDKAKLAEFKARYGQMEEGLAKSDCGCK